MNKTTEALKLAEEALDELYGELSADSLRDGPRCLMLTQAEEALAAIREVLGDSATKAGELHAMKTELWKTEAQEPSRFKLVEYFAGRERRYSKALELACSYLTDGQAKEISDAMPAPEELAQPVKQEPVAKVTVRPFNPMDASCPTTEVKWLMKPVSGFLYAAPVGAEHFLKAIAALREGIETCRAEALNEVVKFLSESGLITPTGRFAAAIRSLKEKP